MFSSLLAPVVCQGMSRWTCVTALGLGWALLACGEPVPSAESSSEATGSSEESDTGSETSGGETSEPQPPDSYWELGDPADYGFDPDALEQVRAWAFGPGMLTQSLLIVRHGALVAEWYEPGASGEDWVTSWSMAKSIAATLIIIAIQDGLIPSLDEPMVSYIPEWAGSEREAVTLRHVLAMSSGFAWGESEDNLADLAAMALSGDQLGYALGQQVELEPGQVWNYSSGNSMLLSRVLAEATGMSVEAYAIQELSEPLGFERFEWWRDGAGNTLTYCCIDMLARDTARLAKLYLQRGVWDGAQLVDPELFDQLLTPGQPQNPSYGLHFWGNREGGAPDWPAIPRSTYYGRGHDKQLLMLLPEQDLAVIRHSRFVRPEGPAEAPNGLLEAGMMLEGLAGDTGTWPPGEDWDDGLLLELTLAAIVD